MFGSSLDVQALRLKDVAPLLTQYHRLRPQVLGKATAELGTLEGAPFQWHKTALEAGSMGRYSHFRAQDLRIGDVVGLQLDFNRLSASTNHV